MVGLSFAIVVVLFVMVIMFLRAGKRGAVLLTFPLFSVPMFYLVAYGGYYLVRGTGIMWRDFSMIVVIAGAILGSAACAYLGRAIPSKRTEKVYLACGLIFQAAIAIGYAINVLL